MIRYYSTRTNKTYDTYKEAHQAEKQINSEAIQIHIRNFQSAKDKYLKDLAAAQQRYTDVKESVVRALEYHQAPPELLQAIQDDGISIEVKLRQ